MSEALARIYALQQTEINEIERRKQIAAAKRRREIVAFQNSGLPALFRSLADVPLRADVRQRIFKQKFSELTWAHCNPTTTNNEKELSCTCLSGYSGSGPRWWCEASADTGEIRYGYQSGRTGSQIEMFSAPERGWLDEFIRFAASACDPAAIAQKIAEVQPEQPQPNPRRQLQPV